MDFLAMFAVSILGTLLLVLLGPFMRDRIWALLWLLVSLAGGLVLQYGAAALVGLVALSRPRSAALLVCLSIVAFAEGWNLAQAYGAGRWVSGVAGVSLLAWVVGWRRKVLATPE